MKSWARVAALIAVSGLAACSKEVTEEAPSGHKHGHAKPKPATSHAAAAGPEADLRNALASRPTECDAGKNDRQVLAVRVTKQEENESGGNKYRKVRGEATIQEKGPCAENAGKHRWSAGITYVEEEKAWRLASFGFDQKRID